MDQGQKKKPPPPPPPCAARPAPSAAPSAEGILVADGGVSAKLLARLRFLLPAAIRDSALIDVSGRITAGGRAIGVHENGRLLLEYGPAFSHIALPPAMRNMLRSGSMVVFIEVKENEACICAGSALGKKVIYSRLG
jgi:hypothetical protein